MIPSAVGPLQAQGLEARFRTTLRAFLNRPWCKNGEIARPNATFTADSIIFLQRLVLLIELNLCLVLRNLTY